TDKRAHGTKYSPCAMRGGQQNQVWMFSFHGSIIRLSLPTSQALLTFILLGLPNDNPRRKTGKSPCRPAIEKAGRSGARMRGKAALSQRLALWQDQEDGRREPSGRRRVPGGQLLVAGRWQRAHATGWREPCRPGCRAVER